MPRNRHSCCTKLRSDRCGASRERDLLDQARAARSCGRAGNRCCPERLEVRPFVASRNPCSRRLAHALDLPRDHPRTRQTLPGHLDKTFPAGPRNSSLRNKKAGPFGAAALQGPSLPVERPLGPARARSRFESYGLAALAAATEQARRAAWCANCSVLVGRSSFLLPCALLRGEASPLLRRAPVPRLRRDAQARRPTRARPRDARGVSGLRTARGLRALLGGPRSAFGVSSVSPRILAPRAFSLLPPSRACRGGGAPRAATRRTRARCRLGNRRGRRGAV